MEILVLQHTVLFYPAAAVYIVVIEHPAAHCQSAQQCQNQEHPDHFFHNCTLPFS